MIKLFNTYSKQINARTINIDPDFPKDKLIKIMRPYLLLDYVSKYSLLPYVKQDATCALRKLLMNFVNYNPTFGRKRYKVSMKNTINMKKKISGKIVDFDDNHIPFNNIKAQNDDFLIDHLTYKETVHHINYYFSNYVDENIGEDNNLEEPYYDVGDDDDEDNEDNEDNEDTEDNEDNTPLLSIFEDGEVEEIDSVS
jgi:hypothetical protein